MPSAPTSRRGLDLNCRLLVNGIQKASRLFGEASKFATSTVEVMMGVRYRGGVRGDYQRTPGATNRRARWPIIPAGTGPGWKASEAPHAQRRTSRGAPCGRAGGRRGGSGGRAKLSEGAHAQRWKLN